MLGSSYKSYFFSLLIIYSPLTAMKTSTAKKLIAKHKTVLQQQKTLNLNNLSAKKRHKLLVTAYDTHDKQMFGVYLNDWSIKQCAQSNYITDLKGKSIAIQDIEKHLEKTYKFKLPAQLYHIVGQQIAKLYLLPYMQENLHDSQLKRAVIDLGHKINQNMAIVLMYAYDANRNNQPTLELPKESIPEKILRKLNSATLKILSEVFNFKIV